MLFLEMVYIIMSMVESITNKEDIDATQKKNQLTFIIDALFLFLISKLSVFSFSLKKLYNIKKHTKDIFITYTRHLSP